MDQKFEHKKSLGQHFLNSDYVPKRMCDAAGLGEVGGDASSDDVFAEAGPRQKFSPRPGLGKNSNKDEVVLEIGPGTGVLTREILNRGAKVVAIEADERAISSLQGTFAEEIASGKLTIFHHDARDLTDLSQFGLEKHSYIVIANIPYYLSGSLFRQLLDTECQPTNLVFLVQKEVAQRIARSEKESLLSLSVKVFGNPTYICTVKRNHFTPPPKVDSAIVAVDGIGRQNLFEILPATPENFFHLIHLGFGQKRKQLISNLVSSGDFNREDVLAALRAASLPDTVRAEDIPLSTWLQLTTQLFSTR